MNGNGARPMRFGEYVVQRGFVEAHAVEEALAIQRTRDMEGRRHQLLGLILIEIGALSNNQLIDALKDLQAEAVS